MNPRPIALGLLLLAFAAPGTARAADPAAATTLPDSTVLVRVGDRVVRAGEFVRLYWDAWPEDRPGTDSLGRVKFMHTVVEKEILADVARKAGRPLDFEQRAELRDYTDRMLATGLFRRLVLDSVEVTDRELSAATRRASVQHRFREIVFDDRATAERVRGDLVRGRVTWSEAWRRHSRAKDPARPDGDLGWHQWLPDAVTDPAIYDLNPGGISAAESAPGGWRVVLKTEERPHPQKPSQGMLRSLIRESQINLRTERVVAGVRRQVGLAYDSANVAWAAARFPSSSTNLRRGSAGIELEIHEDLPAFAPEDTGRVLARYDGGRLSLAGFIQGYGTVPPTLRRPVDTPERMRAAIDAFVLEPLHAEAARRMGLERDPEVARMIELRAEGMRFDRLYADSVTSQIYVSPQERRRHYDAHLPDYVTFPRVRYAGFTAASRAEADSLAARLRAGESAEAVLAGDSLAGRQRGVIREMSQAEQGVPYKRVLFEELRPGQVHLTAPDAQGRSAVIQLLSFDPGRQLSFEEADRYVADSVRSLREEERFKALIARHRGSYRIETRPDLVMRIRFEDPAAR